MDVSVGVWVGVRVREWVCLREWEREDELVKTDEIDKHFLVFYTAIDRDHLHFPFYFENGKLSIRQKELREGKF